MGFDSPPTHSKKRSYRTYELPTIIKLAHPFKGKTKIDCRTHSGAADGVGIKLQRLRALTEDNQ